MKQIKQRFLIKCRCVRRDPLEVAGRANVSLGQFLLLAFRFLVSADQAAVAQHVVEVVGLLVAV